MLQQILLEFDQLQQHLQTAAESNEDVIGLDAIAEQATSLQRKLASYFHYAEEATTESAALQLMLMRERSLLRTMIDLVPVNIFAKDMQSRFLAANTMVARGMGTTPDSLLGKTDFDFFPAEMAQKFFDDEQVIIKSGQALIDREEMALDQTTCSKRTLSTTKVPLRDGTGNIIGVVGIGRDITVQRESERKQQELQQNLMDEIKERERIALELQLAQKLESVGRLAAGVAHEINTPIQFVNDSLYFLRSAFYDINKLLIAYSSALKNLAGGTSLDSCLKAIEGAAAAADLEFLQDEIPKAFERTLDGANRVASIVRAIKEFAHPDTNVHSPADINHAIETTLIVASNEYKYVAKVTTDFAVLPEVTCNIGELNQVFLNMIVNAAHAIQDSGKDSSIGIISIHTAVVDDTVKITIGDNGCGIPQENLDKIYDPFFTTKEVGRGTGQGLAIARSIIIEKHGGSIRAQSAVGTGTQFTLCLPVNRQNDNTTEAIQ